jgi:uncharacterized protein
MASSETSQTQVIEFLSRPETYGLTGSAVERHQTHGALVFLAGDRAYKLKRAVRLPYMDYSTVERRKQMCERELAVNRRTAPEMYLGLKPIVRDHDGQLRLGSGKDGEIGDWVVVMRRFNEDNLLEQMRRHGRLTPDLIRLLGEAIASFHAEAEIRHNFGGGAGMQAIIEENATVLGSMIDQPFDAGKIARLSRLSRAALERLSPVLDRRRDEGRVRRCHGDLHLNNICLIDGRPVLFDSIEFGEEFACIDVFYDLAFLLMDFDRNGLREFANMLLNRYLELSSDYEGVAALPLFLSCRAAIRAHVAATTARLVQPKDAQAASLSEAAHLLDLAIAYLQPPPGRIVAVGGVSGTGKSTLARALAAPLGPAPGAVVLRTDVIRKRLMGVSETTRLPQMAYQSGITSKVYSLLEELSAKLIAAGHAVIVDAVFGNPEERTKIEQVAAAAQVRIDGLWLEANPSLLQDRIVARRADASDATVGVLHRQLEFVVRPDHWVVLDAARPPAEVLDDACHRLNIERPAK